MRWDERSERLICPRNSWLLTLEAKKTSNHWEETGSELLILGTPLSWSFIFQVFWSSNFHRLVLLSCIRGRILGFLQIFLFSDCYYIVRVCELWRCFRIFWDVLVWVVWFFVFHGPLLASIVNIIVMKLSFEEGSISMQFASKNFVSCSLFTCLRWCFIWGWSCYQS